MPVPETLGAPGAGLWLRHRLATSPAGPLFDRLHRMLGFGQTWRHPELGLLRQEAILMPKVLARLIRPDWNTADVGAHVGSFTALLARLAPGGRLFAVEAVPQKAALLARRFPRAQVFAEAASDTPGPVMFHVNTANPGFSSLADRASRGATRAITVPARRLDDMIPRDVPLHFLKIDVEGFEYPALRGAARILSRDRPVILFEAGAARDPDLAMADYPALFAWLTDEMAYDIRAVFDMHYNRPPITAETFALYREYPFLAFNYLATPRPAATANREPAR
ncbi:MAG: FkbM family methyltransferase [Paracoccaceae bacterium]|nr:MAG: FkbM family methyltransferase [Paracoccaceae bacterium]